VDLCLVIGTSLLIPPVKDIPGTFGSYLLSDIMRHPAVWLNPFALDSGRLPDNVPKILINRDRVKGIEWTVRSSASLAVSPTSRAVILP
jgi:NAD-dependent SIR2 family protein deacetylase